ncbi:MAG: hypothetical protein GMKNLPBB_00038 [Myxococcota bacterium]|nr:hypothetical protein [Myxococcota bacterium]
MDLLYRLVFTLVPLILSITVHEYAHALAADRLGDDLPRRQGRVTLDPLAHIDWIGTVALPAFWVLSGINFFFGWGKPVETVPRNYSRRFSMNTGHLFVALAGPGANVALAIVSAIGLRIVSPDGLPQLHGGANPLGQLFLILVILNISLAIFNLLPIPPLDGSRMLYLILPRHIEQKVMEFGPWLFLLILIFPLRFISEWTMEAFRFLIGLVY